MATRSLLGLALLGLSHGAAAALQTCGSQQYDPAQYVCWNGNFLCPVVAGEGLSLCSGACYSKFMYQCTNGALAQLPRVTHPFTLTISNPTLPINGLSVNACGQTWNIGGQTCTYCPTQVGTSCPPGSVTAMVSGGDSTSMDTEVPGGQQVYLDPYWDVAYTQAHSAYIPPGSVTTGLVAYKGGGFINLNGNGMPWVACPPMASGGGGGLWNLRAENATNAASLSSCTPVNLKVTEIADGPTAWQYT